MVCLSSLTTSTELVSEAGPSTERCVHTAAQLTSRSDGEIGGYYFAFAFWRSALETDS